MSRKSSSKRSASRRRSMHNKLLAELLVAFVILFALCNLISKDRDFSDSENRSLQGKPSFTLSALTDGSYFSETLSHYSDQFFLRDRWISLKLTTDRLMGRKDENGVMLGKNGYLIGFPETPSEEAVEQLTSSMTAFSNKYPDYTMRAMIVPSASQILTDDLPKNAPVRDQLEDIQDLYDSLPSTIQCIDASSALLEHSDEYIYYKTDHHWTSLGAYYVFSDNFDRLGLDGTSSGFDIYTVTDDFEGTLASKCGYHGSKDTITIYGLQDDSLEYYVYNPESGTKTCSIYDSSKLDEKSKYNVFFGDNYPLLEIQTTANNGQTLLVFKDSYANSFIQFLLPHYEKIIMIDPRYYYDDLGAYLNTAGVTDVLFLFSADTFLTDASTADVLDSAS